MSAENGALSERKKLILKAIVDAHIQNGEPVGSKYLTQNKQISHSSAISSSPTLRRGASPPRRATHFTSILSSIATISPPRR